MHRRDIEELTQEQIVEALGSGDLKDGWNTFVGQAGDQATQIFRTICSVSPAERISELRELEARQTELGAGFYGMLPDQIPDDLALPVDLTASLDLAIQLAYIRAANLKAMAETMPDYAIAFGGERFEPGPIAPVPEGWSLDIDVDGIRAVLDHFDEGTADAETSARIARMPAFAGMLRHRRELGYVPEPVIDADGLAWSLGHAASRDPIDELWKWLHPQNLFDLSDLYAHRTEYRRLIDQLAADDGLAAHILGALAPYAPADVVFNDRLTFAVGWAIRGWATDETGGMNIEHAKDDFARMIPTLVHETFHRFQARVALADPTSEDAGFGRITSYPFEEKADAKLYEAVCYVMLEGSATFVAKQGALPDWQACVPAGLEILVKILAIDPAEEGDDAYDALLNEGLTSNGPFYGLGAWLSHVIVAGDGPSDLGGALRRGAPAFVKAGLGLAGDLSITPAPELLAAIDRLDEMIMTSNAADGR